MKLARRTSSISASPTLAITARVKEMKAKGINVIGFGAGEPDFDTPDYIKDAAKTAINEGFTKYTSPSGMPELKDAICKKLKEDNGLEYEPSQVIVSCGAKHSLFNIVMCLCEKGDEVLLPSPYWVTYPEQVKFAGAKPVIIETVEYKSFKVSTEALKSAITKNTKCLILNSPSNPTGTVYTKEELGAIADLAVKHKFYIISDEIYEKILYDGTHTSIASLGPEVKELTIVVNGVSKAYSMTGWRIGYAAGPKDIISAMSKLQSQSTSNPASIAQKAALAALIGQGFSPVEKNKELDAMVNEFRKRRDFMVKKINAIPGLSCLKPGGAFYVFPNIKNLIGKETGEKKIKDSLSLAELLLDEAKVAVVPGIAFGADNYIRLSYATSMDNIKEGMQRIDALVNKLTG